MNRLRRRVMRLLRKSLGNDNYVERVVRKLDHTSGYRVAGFSRTTTSCVFKGDPDRRLGIYGYAGCDVWAIADAGPALRELTGATGGIFAEGRADFTRSDLILQGYDGVNPDHIAEVMERLNGKPIMMKPELFKKQFTIPAYRQAGAFDKDVVALSISSDLARVIYRHRKHGFIIDPGGFWLASGVEETLKDLDTVKWFSTEFEKIGRLSVDESMNNFRRLVPLVRETTGGHVVVFNSLTVDPGRRVMDYQLSHSPHRTRRREFATALVDLARELDFSIIDVDRVVKGVGVEGLGDFVKFTPKHKEAVGDELIRVLVDREVI